MAIVEVVTRVIHRCEFDVLVGELTLKGEVERLRQINHFLKYDGFCLYIWHLANQAKTAISRCK